MKQELIDSIEYALAHTLKGCRSPMKKATDPQSCCAVYEAIRKTNRARTFRDYNKHSELMDNFEEVIADMGLTGDLMFDAFTEFPSGPERQQARALWLTWVQLMVKEGEVA